MVYTVPQNLPAAGHRIGTAEVENTLTDHSACSEAAVIGWMPVNTAHLRL